MPQVTYPLDTTGEAVTNLVKQELHTLTSINSAPYRALIPEFAPFYLNNLLVEHIEEDGTVNPLTIHENFNEVFPWMDASRKTRQHLYGGILLTDLSLSGTIRLTYQTIGDKWCVDRDYVYNVLLSKVYNPRIVWWDQITNVHDWFPVIDHPTEAEDITGIERMIEELGNITRAILEGTDKTPASFVAHMTEIGNVHSMTASDINLGQVQNLPLATDEEVLNRIPVTKYVTLRQVLMLLNQHS